MSSRDYIAINGVALPYLKKDGLVIDKEKVWAANTGRAANGLMIGDLVAIKYKLKCEWPPLTRSEVALIDSLVSRAYFNVTFTDPATDSRLTITAYAGAPSYSVYSYIDGVKTYSGVAVDLIQM